MLNIHQTMAECDCPRPDKCTLAGRCLASGSICPHCALMTAASPEQLDIRLKNMALHPEVRPHACTQCGSTDWAYVVIPRSTARRESDPTMVPVYAAVAVLVASAAVGGWYFGSWFGARPWYWTVVALALLASVVVLAVAVSRGRRE